MSEEADRLKVKEEFKRQARDEGLCDSFKSFSLGAAGTALVSCGLKKGHEVVPYHTTHQKFPDGSSVTFRWE